jgi:hypothetical protein
MDHVSGWTKDGKGVLLCQPYHLNDDDLRDLTQTAARLGLKVDVHGVGWYGHGTVAIELAPAQPQRAALRMGWDIKPGARHERG